jgi:hypothetical protein
MMSLLSIVGCEKGEWIKIFCNDNDSAAFLITGTKYQVSNGGKG